MSVVMGFWLYAVFSDVFAEALVIWAFWKQRHTSWVGYYWAAVVVGCLVESLGALFVVISMLSGQLDMPTSISTVVIREICRAAKSAGFWAMAIKLLKEAKA